MNGHLHGLDGWMNNGQSEGWLDDSMDGWMDGGQDGFMKTGWWMAGWLDS